MSYNPTNMVEVPTEYKCKFVCGSIHPVYKDNKLDYNESFVEIIPHGDFIIGIGIHQNIISFPELESVYNRIKNIPPKNEDFSNIKLMSDIRKDSRFEDKSIMQSGVKFIDHYGNEVDANNIPDCTPIQHIYHNYVSPTEIHIDAIMINGDMYVLASSLID